MLGWNTVPGGQDPYLNGVKGSYVFISGNYDYLDDSIARGLPDTRRHCRIRSICLRLRLLQRGRACNILGRGSRRPVLHRSKPTVAAVQVCRPRHATRRARPSCNPDPQRASRAAGAGERGRIGLCFGGPPHAHTAAMATSSNELPLMSFQLNPSRRYLLISPCRDEAQVPPPHARQRSGAVGATSGLGGGRRRIDRRNPGHSGGVRSPTALPPQWCGASIEAAARWGPASSRPSTRATNRRRHFAVRLRVQARPRFRAAARLLREPDGPDGGGAAHRHVLRQAVLLRSRERPRLRQLPAGAGPIRSPGTRTRSA